MVTDVCKSIYTVEVNLDSVPKHENRANIRLVFVFRVVPMFM